MPADDAYDVVLTTLVALSLMPCLLILPCLLIFPCLLILPCILLVPRSLILPISFSPHSGEKVAEGRMRGAVCEIYPITVTHKPACPLQEENQHCSRSFPSPRNAGRRWPKAG